MGILPRDEIKGYSSLGYVLINEETGKPCLVSERTLHKIMWPKQGGFRSLQDIINGLKVVRTEIYNTEYDDLQALGEYVGNQVCKKKGHIERVSYESLEGYRPLQANEMNEFIDGLMRGYNSN